MDSLNHFHISCPCCRGRLNNSSHFNSEIFLQPLVHSHKHLFILLFGGFDANIRFTLRNHIELIADVKVLALRKPYGCFIFLFDRFVDKTLKSSVALVALRKECLNRHATLTGAHRDNFMARQIVISLTELRDHIGSVGFGQGYVFLTCFFVAQ